MKTLRPPAAALAYAILLGTVAMSPMLFPAAAVAQAPQASQPERTVFGIRFLGEWVDDYGLKYVFTDAGGGKLKSVVTRPSTGETVATMDWEPRPEGMGGPFRVPGQNPADPSSDRGITGYVDHEGGAFLYVRSGRFPNGHQAQAHPDKGPGSRPYNFSLKRPSGARAVNERAWMGQWRTSRGLLDFRNDGHGMFGVIRSGEPTSATARVALRGDTGGIAFGAWEKEGEWSSTVDRGDLWLQQSADGTSFRGYYTEVNGSGSRRMEWTGERVAEGESSDGQTRRPTEAQTSLGRELEGTWRDLSRPSFWRFTPDHQGRVKAVTWPQADEAGVDAVMIWLQPNGDGRRFSGRSLTGTDFDVLKDGQGRVAVIAENGAFQSTTWLERLQSTPRDTSPARPTEPAPTVPSPATPASPRPAPPSPEQPAAGFQPLEKWDVRVDRVENPRDDRLTHVYLTLRNSGTGNLVQTQGVSVRHEDGDGVVTESGQGLRAKPGRPELFGSPPPAVLPGREIKTKFVFDRNGGTTRITVVEGQATADFDF